MIFLLLAVCHTAAAQVKGIVSDATDGTALPGVTVRIKGRQTVSITDSKGFYQIEALKNDTLVFSFIGLQTQEEAVGGRGEINISLQENRQELGEIVVVGYGTQRRKELTGAISTVSKAILEQPAVSFDAMLGGAVAGLNVTQESGQPGASGSIRIRGGNSVDASNNPLYVIDGFIFYGDKSATQAGLTAIDGVLNPLSVINPSDIESIEILKDVSATAIYGSRGSNGVIIVTTKKGKRENGSVSYQYTVGWDRAAKKIDLLSATRWMRIQKNYFNNNKLNFSDDEIDRLGKGSDWQGAILQTGVSQTHDISVSGGNDRLRYLLSGNYTDQKGIMLNTGFERYSGRVNIDHNITDRLAAGISATAGQFVQDALSTFENVGFSNTPYSAGITNSLSLALYMPPVISIYKETGDYNHNNPFEHGYLRNGDIAANPVADLENSTAQTVNTALLGNFYAKYILVEGLTAKLNAGRHISYVTQNYFAPSYTSLGFETNGVGGIGNKRQDVALSEYTLSYIKGFDGKHFMDVLAGYTYQNTKISYANSLTSHFSNESLGVNNLADGSNPYVPVSGASEAKLYSILGRVNYSLRERYNFTATVRGDKSTHLARKHRWGYFPSAGFSWNINEEAFLKPLKKLSNLKLRLTYGSVGNQEIGEYLYLQTFKATSRYDGKPVYTLSNYGNDNLKWETSVQYNAGIDAGWFNNRLSFVADVYYKKTYDLLLSVPADPTQIVKTKLENVGNVTNKGVEFSFNTVPVENRLYRWTVSANIARNINRITELGRDKPILLGEAQDEILQKGEAVGSFYGYVFEGIVQEGEDVSKLPVTPYGTPRPGDIKFRDTGGAEGIPDGKIDAWDRTVIGNVQPDFIYGLQSTFNYRGFDVFISFQGSQGNKIYNFLYRFLESPDESYNATATVWDSWTPENRSNRLPGLSNIAGGRTYGSVDSRYVEDASYLRLKNITLGYQLQITNYKLRIFAAARNLFTLTGYKGYDPEVSRGIDYGAYPTARTFSIGTRISY